MRRVLIWGAAGGIGRAFVEATADSADVVVAVARNAAPLRDLTPYVVDADLTDPDAVTRAITTASAVSDMFDLVIMCAGDIASVRVADLDLDTWTRLLNNNLTTAFLTLQATASHLAPDATVVVVGAIHERLRLPGLGAYAATKAGLEAFVEAWRKEVRRRVVIVRPAAVDTPLWDKVSFALPRGAMSAASLVSRALEAVDAGHEGPLDITA